MESIDDVLLRVVKVGASSRGNPLTAAAGFFYRQNSYLYRIPARHVVSKDTIQRHPKFGDGADLADGGITDPHVLARHCISTFRPQDFTEIKEETPLGQEVMIRGFPLGFHDAANHSPTVFSATPANSFAHPFMRKSCFSSDGLLPRGMSGLPVIARRRRWYDRERDGDASWRRLGVPAAAIGVTDRCPNQDDRPAWYAAPIRETIPRRTATAPAERLERLRSEWFPALHQPSTARAL